ncbi:hypothetical protein [Streptomyces halobius]|uniref:LPXTG-motif cell wall-anchored protein n=1 Tax=Streptomyces halobius TaxID=2879846 RepID=A0ABY4MED8_9ACTN|nr:hypothetical protein [Streptomyces halobius]UQA96144.1 hypothetical protein K9S39_33545 [Streptomyces halobius]
MRSSRVLTGAALSVAALSLSTTAASAGDFGTIEASPGAATAGSTVSLTSNACGKNGSARVDASALGAGIIHLSSTGRAHSGNVQGTLRIPSGTRPGNYGLGGICSHGKELTGTVGVSKISKVGKTAKGGEGSTVSEHGAGGGPPGATAGSSATPAPKGKAKTGAGTTAESSSASEIASGSALVMAAVAGGIWMLRRRREGGRS